MIRFLTAENLQENAPLADSMFCDRARQFRDRLGWPVMVDAEGRELDQYDRLKPIYIVDEVDGVHQASMRAMPTLGRTMAAEHFAEACGGPIQRESIWECTRFAVAPQADAKAARRVMLGGQVFGLLMGLRSAIGIYDLPMERVYRRLGWEPRRLGSQSIGDGVVCAGLWAFSTEIRDRLSDLSGLDVATVEDAFRTVFLAEHLDARAA